MDRIGAIREFCEMKQRRLPVASVRSFRRYLLILLAVVFFLAGFTAGNAYASTVPACRVASISNGGFSFVGCETEIPNGWCSYILNLAGSGTCSGNINSSLQQLSVIFNGAGTGPYSYSLTGAYSCPSGSTLIGTSCESSLGLTLSQIAAVDWLLVNQAAIQNVLNTQPAQQFDIAVGGAFWAFGFVGVMILYFSSHVIGLVLKAVKHG